MGCERIQVLQIACLGYADRTEFKLDKEQNLTTDLLLDCFWVGESLIGRVERKKKNKHANYGIRILDHQIDYLALYHLSYET